MNKAETIALMKIIRGYYPAYYRNDETVRDAVTLWTSALEDEDFNWIQKGLKKFVKTDTKGFPPVPGQIITLAHEIRKQEWEQRRREADLLPEPEMERTEMPDYIRNKLSEIFPDRRKL